MTLDDVRKQLAIDKPFGDDIDAGERQLLAACHPDLHDGSEEAAELFKQVQAAAEQARHPIVLKGKRHSYPLGNMLANGDVADLYRSGNYLVKASRVQGGDVLLRAESEALATIHTEAGDSKYRLYFPLPVESFQIRDTFAKRINVFDWAGDYLPLTTVLAKHKTLDGRHVGWIFKRLLIAIGFANRLGLVHGAILPQHLLINPDSHGLRLIGWGQSVKSGGVIKAVPSAFKDWYPPEVIDKKPATAETDIFMAARCAMHVGGDALELREFLLGCVLPGQKMRPGDAWALYEEFEELLRTVYGPPKFHVLAMT